jgi:ethanolamine utilization microcompartment shell protein EutS
MKEKMFYCGAMALSEHEKRLLDQMEAALLTEDPKLATTLSGTKMPIARNRSLLAIALLALGLATIFGGLIAKVTLIGVIGFLVALSGLILLISSVGAVTKAVNSPRSPRKGFGLSDRLEKRWDERNTDQ